MIKKEIDFKKISKELVELLTSYHEVDYVLDDLITLGFDHDELIAIGFEQEDVEYELTIAMHGLKNEK
jgi:hypothetical protein